MLAVAFQKNVLSREVVANGATIKYYDSGIHATSKESVLLLHGTGGTAENNFWALFPMLAMRHRVVALDFLDPDSEEDVTAGHYVQQAVSVLRSAQDGLPMHLVGYSFGAVIAAEVAAKHGELLRSLSLVSGWAKTDAQQRLRNDIWRTLYATNSDALASYAVFTNFSQAFLNSKNAAEIEALVSAVALGPDRSKKMAFNRTVDITNVLPDIDVPSLVVGCTHDQTAPVRHSRMLFGGIGNCRYAEINSGHGVAHERPSELFTMLDRFVSDVNATPPGHVLTNRHA
jgi:pimeloyl-ACP methyl ester carboxylesterase